MSFLNRISTSNIIIEIMEREYWNKLRKQFKIVHEPYGYETHTSTEMQELLKKDNSSTSRHIKYTPDYILTGIYNNEVKTMLFEYKVTKTPRYSLKDEQWNVGQIEADAWENYLNLQKTGVQTAVIIYCPYHSRPLICDYPNQNWEKNKRQKVKFSRGSGTEYININLNLLRSFDDFMAEEFGVKKDITENLLSKDLFKWLSNHSQLVTNHHFNSFYKKNETGFNWRDRYR